MARMLIGLVAGLLFGVGLAVSEMINPAKVLSFLDIFGRWDASLAFVMLGAVVTSAIGYRLAFRRERPLLEPWFMLPTRQDIDSRLLAGSAIFGIGWGLGGYCPGPAISGLGFGALETLVFVTAMASGMIIWRIISSTSPRTDAGVDCDPADLSTLAITTFTDERRARSPMSSGQSGAVRAEKQVRPDTRSGRMSWLCPQRQTGVPPIGKPPAKR